MWELYSFLINFGADLFRSLAVVTSRTPEVFYPKAFYWCYISSSRVLFIQRQKRQWSLKLSNSTRNYCAFFSLQIKWLFQSVFMNFVCWFLIYSWSLWKEFRSVFGVCKRMKLSSSPSCIFISTLLLLFCFSVFKFCFILFINRISSIDTMF